MSPALGIDVGGSAVKVALRDAAGGWTTGRSRRYAQPSAGEVEGAIREAAGSLLRDGFGASGVPTIGTCVPGVVDAATGTIAASVNAPGLVGAPIEALVRRAIGAERAAVRTVSDARAAAYDWWTTSPLPGRLLAVSMGTGVGACVLDNGVPLEITGPSSGHLGQVDVTLEGGDVPAAADGSVGTLEAYVGLAALGRRSGNGPADVEAGLARLRVSDEPMRALVRGLRIAHAIYRPQRIVLLGGVGIRLGHLGKGLRAAVAEGLTSLARPGWTLDVGTSDFHAAMGAAILAAEGG